MGSDMARMGRSCRSGSGWIFGLLLLLISTSVGQNTTRAKEYQPEGCLRCGQPCLQAAENTLLPCITAAVGEATMCKYLVAPFEVVQSVLFTQAVFAQRFPYE